MDPLDLIVADCAVMWLSENWVNFYLAQNRGWSSRWRLGEVWDYHLICLLLYILVVLECTWISEILQLMLYCITPYFQIDHVQKKFCSLSPFLINLTFTHTILGYQIPKGLCWHLSPKSMWSGGFIIPIHRPVDGALDLYGPLLILNDCTAYQLP